MSTTLIAVVTCKGRSKWADIIRKTWAPLCSSRADVLFFTGSGANLPLTVELDCDDSYQGLPDKVREIVRYSLQHGYEYVLKCDDDVVINPNAVLSSGYDKYDFSGHESTVGSSVPYGFNYWMSKRSMQVVARQELPNNNNDEAWVAHALLAEGIALHHDPRYRLHMGPYQAPVDSRRPLRKSEKYKPASVRYFSWCLHNKTAPFSASQAEFETLHRLTQEA